MPELPEVETVRLGLLPIMVEKTVLRFEQRRLDLRWPLPKNMPERLNGTKIKNILRRSKYLLFNFDSDETLITHLGMSGRLIVLHHKVQTTTEIANFNFKTHKLDKHDHLIFHLDEGVRVIYNDPRRFGAMDLVRTEEINLHKWLIHLGPEPFSNELSSDSLYHKLQKRTCSIKSALMNQKLISGLGNIYVLEALWAAGISPERKANKLGKVRTKKLLLSVRNVLLKAIDAGGTSLQDFRRVGGGLGYFQNKLNVYGRFGKECTNIDCLGTIKIVKQSGRASYYCNACQK